MMLNEQNIQTRRSYIYTHKQLDLQTHTMTMAIRINGENESEQNKKDEIFFCFVLFWLFGENLIIDLYLNRRRPDT